MRGGRILNIEELVSDTDNKGEFIEFCIYDFFEFNNYFTQLVGTNTKDRKIISQRMINDYGIIVPDIICQNKYKELLFIESKSRWLNVDFGAGDITERRISEKTFLSYLRFQDEVFARSENIRVSAQILICFSTVRYSVEDSMGNVSCNFVRLSELRNLKSRLVKIEDSKNKEYIWRETDILEASYKSKQIGFSYDAWFETFSNKYSNDIYSRNRNNFILTEKSMKKLMNEWLWCA